MFSQVLVLVDNSVSTSTVCHILPAPLPSSLQGSSAASRNFECLQSSALGTRLAKEHI